jgi:DNA-binding winged helix-turn-helix (wHTH) protein
MDADAREASQRVRGADVVKTSSIRNVPREEPSTAVEAINDQVSTVTVVLAGPGELGQIRAFLALGAVVVVAPDDETLRTWIGENLTTPPHVYAQRSDGLSIQMLARRVMFDGEELPLTDLDYRILTLLASEPERARSFHEIRQAAWGPAPDLLADVFSVRSAVQRLRRKLRDAAAPVVIESVRAYGFRLVRASVDSPPDEEESAPAIGPTSVINTASG